MEQWVSKEPSSLNFFFQKYELCNVVTTIYQRGQCSAAGVEPYSLKVRKKKTLAEWIKRLKKEQKKTFQGVWVSERVRRVRGGEVGVRGCQRATHICCDLQAAAAPLCP